MVATPALGHLEQLGGASQPPNVTVQVLPLRGGHPIIIGSFVVSEFGEACETTLPYVVYTEHLRSGLFQGEATPIRAGSAELIPDLAKRVRA